MQTYTGKTGQAQWASSSKVFQGYWKLVFWPFLLIKESYSKNNRKNNQCSSLQWILLQNQLLLPFSSILFSLPFFFFQEAFCVWWSIRWKVNDLLVLVSWALICGCSHLVCNTDCVVSLLHREMTEMAGSEQVKFLEIQKREWKMRQSN